MVVLLVFSFPSNFRISAATINESEGNNNIVQADVTADDNNNYGTLSSSLDVDWWSISFSQTGMVNFWLGGLPSNCNYDLSVYEGDGSNLLAFSNIEVAGQAELLRVRVYVGNTYYIKVEAGSGTFVSGQYLLRAKRYNLTAAKTFTYNLFDDINSRPVAAAINPYFRNLGYDTGEFLNNHARACYTVLPDCDILTVATHANAGLMNMKSSSQNSFFYGSAPLDTSTYNRAFSNFEVGGLGNVDLILLVGCKTGLTDTSGNRGNLVDMALSRGAMCAIGWRETIYQSDLINWCEQFTISMYRGYTVRDAMANTASWFDQNGGTSVVNIKNVYYGDSKVDSLVIG